MPAGHMHMSAALVPAGGWRGVAPAAPAANPRPRAPPKKGTRAARRQLWQHALAWALARRARLIAKWDTTISQACRRVITRAQAGPRATAIYGNLHGPKQALKLPPLSTRTKPAPAPLKPVELPFVEPAGWQKGGAPDGCRMPQDGWMDIACRQAATLTDWKAQPLIAFAPPDATFSKQSLGLPGKQIYAGSYTMHRPMTHHGAPRGPGLKSRPNRPFTGTMRHSPRRPPSNLWAV